MTKSMTVSVAKGGKSESSQSHNMRKSRREKFEQKVKQAKTEKDKEKALQRLKKFDEKFYGKKGHRHIRSQYTNLNEDLKNRNIVDVYDEAFGEAIEEYNGKQRRKDRKLGKGKALSKDEKMAKIVAWDLIHTLKKTSKTGIITQNQANKVLKTLSPLERKIYVDFANLSNQMTLRDVRKKLTEAKHAETLGKVLYDKQKSGKQTRTEYEFIMQVGNAKDFNKTNEKGELVDKEGHVLTSTKEEDIKKLVSLERKDPDGKWQKAKKTLEKYYQSFEQRNGKYMKIVSASIHMDEATPHLHLQIVPVAEAEKTTKMGRKRKGLSVKPSFNGALECLGYKRSEEDNKKQFSDWQANEQKVLEKIMFQEMGYTRQKGETNRLKNFREYKEVQSKAVEAQQVYQENFSKAEKLSKVMAQTVKTLDTRKKNIDEKEKDLALREEKVKQKEKELNIRENGYTDPQTGEKHLGIVDREKSLKGYNAKIEANKKKIDGQLDKIVDLENGIIARQDLSDSLDDDINEKTKLINRLDEESQNLQDSVAVSTSLSSEAEKKRLKKQKELADLQKQIKEQKEKSKNFEKQLGFAKKLKSVWVESATVFFEECADNKSADKYKPKDLGDPWYSRQLPKYKNADLKISQLKALGKYRDPSEYTIDDKPKSSLQNVVDTAKKALKKPHIFINAVKKALKKVADLLEDETFKKDVESFDSLDVNPAKANLDIMKYNQKQSEERRQREDEALKMKPARPSFSIGDRTKTPQKENNHNQDFDF